MQGDLGVWKLLQSNVTVQPGKDKAREGWSVSTKQPLATPVLSQKNGTVERQRMAGPPAPKEEPEPVWPCGGGAGSLPSRAHSGL